MKYIHYGHTEFDISKFNKVVNSNKFTKPEGGFWASRVDALFGWREWCIDKKYKFDLEKSMIFSLSEDARILVIDSHKGLENLPKNEKKQKDIKICTFLDFEELSKKYDAIEVLISKDDELFYDLYGWDCDSIFIMNPNIIK